MPGVPLSLRLRDFDASSGPIDRRVMTALAKVGMAMRHSSWAGASDRGLTVTQTQILTALLRASSVGVRPTTIAHDLAVTVPTISDAVEALARKGLVRRAREAADRRARPAALTARGRREASRVSDWPDTLLEAASVLEPREQAVLLRGLLKMIRALLERGQVPAARMCLTCWFFRPNAHADAQRPHHCARVDVAFGDRQLRPDCPDHVPAPDDVAQRAWEAFLDTGRRSNHEDTHNRTP
jgi:DNA-binding MarR family transcriptional regulator